MKKTTKPRQARMKKVVHGERRFYYPRTRTLAYIVRDETWKGRNWRDVRWKQAYTPDGYWIGSPKLAHNLTKKHGLHALQPAYPDREHLATQPCSIGYNPDEKRWYGWSHRAIVAFGDGDKIFRESYPGATGDTPFTKHGTTIITKMSQAKLAAKRFAKYIT